MSRSRKLAKFTSHKIRERPHSIHLVGAHTRLLVPTTLRKSSRLRSLRAIRSKASSLAPILFSKHVSSHIQTHIDIGLASTTNKYLCSHNSRSVIDPLPSSSPSIVP